MGRRPPGAQTTSITLPAKKMGELIASLEAQTQARQQSTPTIPFVRILPKTNDSTLYNNLVNSGKEIEARIAVNTQQPKPVVATGSGKKSAASTPKAIKTKTSKSQAPKRASPKVSSPKVSRGKTKTQESAQKAQNSIEEDIARTLAFRKAQKIASSVKPAANDTGRMINDQKGSGASHNLHEELRDTGRHYDKYGLPLFKEPISPITDFREALAGNGKPIVYVDRNGNTHVITSTPSRPVVGQQAPVQPSPVRDMN